MLYASRSECVQMHSYNMESACVGRTRSTKFRVVFFLPPQVCWEGVSALCSYPLQRSHAFSLFFQWFSHSLVSQRILRTCLEIGRGDGMSVLFFLAIRCSCPKPCSSNAFPRFLLNHKICQVAPMAPEPIPPRPCGKTLFFQ